MIALFRQRLINGCVATGYLLAVVGAGFLHTHHDAGACGHGHAHQVIGQTCAQGVSHKALHDRNACRHAHGHAVQHLCAGEPGGRQGQTRKGLSAPERPARGPRQQHEHGCAACDFLAMPLVPAVVVAISRSDFVERAERTPCTPAVARLVASDHLARGPPVLR